MRNPRTSALPRFLGALATAALCMLALGAGNASAVFSIEEFDGETTANQGGDAATQAGSHPFASTIAMEYNNELLSGSVPYPEEQAKNQIVGLPAGTVGSPNAVPKCSLGEWYGSSNLEQTGCVDSSAIGTARIDLLGEAYFFPVYNVVAGPNEPAKFGFKPLSSSIFLTASVRNGGDYGVTVTVPNTSQGLPVAYQRLELWGVPADSAHDPFRGSCLTIEGGSSGECPYNPQANKYPPKPFLTQPTECSGPLVTTLRADSWSEPGNYLEASFPSHNALDEPVGIEGCSKVPFNPSLQMQVDPGKADSPAALRVNLHVPQNEAPGGLATSALKKAVVALPQGVSVNTAAASGLEGCSEAQFGLHANEPAHCPDASKIGTAKITTPLLEDPLEGALYLAQQNANPFGSLLVAYLVAEGHGVIIKQAARLDLDSNTGQITATFDNFPQLPVSEVELGFFGGPRAVLGLPGSCGTYQASYALIPTSGNPPTTGAASFEVNQGCNAGGFNPSFAAGTTQPVAGAHAPFALGVGRNDREQSVGAPWAHPAEGRRGENRRRAALPGAECGYGQLPSGQPHRAGDGRRRRGLAAALDPPARQGADRGLPGRPLQGRPLQSGDESAGAGWAVQPGHDGRALEGLG